MQSAHLLSLSIMVMFTRCTSNSTGMDELVIDRVIDIVSISLGSATLSSLTRYGTDSSQQLGRSLPWNMTDDEAFLWKSAGNINKIDLYVHAFAKCDISIFYIAFSIIKFAVTYKFFMVCNQLLSILTKGSGCNADLHYINLNLQG